MRRRDSQGLWDGHVHTAIFKTEPTRNYCIAHNSAQCYVATWMGGEFGGEWIHVYVWPSPFSVHLKPSQHCQSDILQYTIKSFKRSLKNFRCAVDETPILWLPDAKT